LDRDLFWRIVWDSYSVSEPVPAEIWPIRWRSSKPCKTDTLYPFGRPSGRYSVAYLPADGKWLVSSGGKDSTLKYWNIAPFKHIWSLHTKEPQRTNDFADHLQLKPVREFSRHTVCWFSFLLLSPPNKSFLLSHNRALSSPLLCPIMANGSSLVPEISVSISGMLIMQ